MRILSIDPGHVTGIILVDYATDLTFDEEPISILDFANFRLELPFEIEKRAAFRTRYMHRQLTKLKDYIRDTNPDLVIIENFIMFAQQMGQFGRSFSTSECIGVIEAYCLELDIPVIKQRSSDLRGKSPGVYDSGLPKPRKFREQLNNKALKERGLLVSRRYNRLHLVVGDKEYCLKDYQEGSKNDHMLMALRHIIYCMEINKKTAYDKINEFEEAKEKTYEEVN